MFLIFYLDDDLKVYKGDEFVKPELMEIVFREGRVLNLADKFEFIFSDVLSGLDEEVQKMYFLVGDRAGFTDTRVVYTWLKSWKMFNPQGTSVYIEKIGEKVDLLKFTEQEFADFLKTVEKESSDSLVYSSAPRIGTK